MTSLSLAHAYFQKARKRLRALDRLIVAAARAVGATLVTKDQVLTDLGLVPVVWW